MDRPNCGLVLQPDLLWDGNLKTSFIVSGRSDSNYVKEPITHRSVSGGCVMLNDMPIRFRSSTQKKVALLIEKSELYAAIMTAQYMLYLLHVMKSIGVCSTTYDSGSR